MSCETMQCSETQSSDEMSRRQLIYRYHAGRCDDTGSWRCSCWISWLRRCVMLMLGVNRAMAVREQISSQPGLATCFTQSVRCHQAIICLTASVEVHIQQRTDGLESWRCRRQPLIYWVNLTYSVTLSHAFERSRPRSIACQWEHCLRFWWNLKLRTTPVLTHAEFYFDLTTCVVWVNTHQFSTVS